MADLWNFIVWILIAAAPLYLTIWFFKSEEKDQKIRHRQSSLSALRREPVGYRKRTEPFNKELKQKVLGYTKGKCFYCYANLTSDYWEVDHLWPLKLGGVNEEYNLVASCKKCNKDKFINNPFYWMVVQWFKKGSLNEFELRFLKYYSVNTPSHLTTNKYWDSYMEKVPKNIIDFLNLINQPMNEKKRKDTYDKYIRIFGNRPEKFEITVR